MRSQIITSICLLILCSVILLLESCCYDCCEDCDYYYKEWGFRAVYSNELDDIVSLEAPRRLRNPGKIYTYQHYLLVNEVQQGVHIIDNTDPRNPVPLNFLKIIGNNDVAIKNGVLYADQFRNLITVNLDSLASRIEKNRLMEVFNSYAYYDLSPDITDVYYECPDPSLGVVVNWEADSVEFPCYKY